MKFDKDGKLVLLDGLSAKADILKAKSDEKFEDYKNKTLDMLKKEGYIPKEYKLVDKQDILDNGYKVVFEKENSFNVKNPYNIITVSFDKKTNGYPHPSSAKTPYRDYPDTIVWTDPDH